MESAPVQRSLLSWVLNSLGIPCLILLLLTGLVCFVLALIIVVRGRGPMAVAALVLTVHAPILIGLAVSLQSAITSYTLIATSGTAPKPSDVAVGISSALVAPLLGIGMAIPAYATAVIGAFIRCLCDISSQKS